MRAHHRLYHAYGFHLSGLQYGIRTVIGIPLPIDGTQTPHRISGGYKLNLAHSRDIKRVQYNSILLAQLTEGVQVFR